MFRRAVLLFRASSNRSGGGGSSSSASAGGPMTPRKALSILSLSPSADLNHAAIKKAYVKQTLLCHPDLYPTDPKATEKFRSLSDALRVALTALEVRHDLANSNGGDKDGAGGNGVYDSQAALEALRRAIIAYRLHRESARTGGTETIASAEEGGGGSSGGGGGGGGGAGTATPHDSSGNNEDETFFTPTLEYVSSVCQSEALAMRRVRVFCDELPAVLCGSTSAALFEAVAFFHARYVQATSECVLRFSKNLPVIVRRVIKNRRKFIRNTHTKATTGFGTGGRPRQQRIEDMAMRPLVLVGALIFDLQESTTTATKKEGSTFGSDGSVTSTCGVSRPRDITVCDELKCTIYPSDSIAAITEKLGAWEAASYQRLKLELAIVDVCVFLSGMIRLSNDGSDGDVNGGGGGGGDGEEDGEGSDHSLAVVPHLHMERAVTERVLLTLQRLACGMCDAFDESLDFTQRAAGADHCDGDVDDMSGDGSATDPTASVEDKVAAVLALLGSPPPPPPPSTEEGGDNRKNKGIDNDDGSDEAPVRMRRYAAVAAKSAEDDAAAAASLSLPRLIAECRQLARMAAPGLKGSINVTWHRDEKRSDGGGGGGDPDEDLVASHGEVIADNNGSIDSKKEEGSEAASNNTSSGSGGQSTHPPPPPPPPPRPGFQVGRHADCCAAEMVSFAVSLDLSKDLRTFLLRLRTALKTVVVEYGKAHAIVRRVTAVRDATVNGEFILIKNSDDGDATVSDTAADQEQKRNGSSSSSTDSDDSTTTTANGNDNNAGEEKRRYRYRGPVYNFTRTYGMVTSRELVFWQRLHANREYLAGHAAAMNQVNIYLDCLPSTTTTGIDGQQQPMGKDAIISGWVGDSPDEGGACDNAILTTAELEPGPDGAATFRTWLEDVVEQSTLNRECHAVMDAAGIGYVVRDPTLPLTNFLSFIKVFAQAAAVRSVLETRGHHHNSNDGSGNHHHRRPRVVGSEDTGISVVVGHRCDVRDGGRLLVPWSMDPTALIALLGEGEAAARELPGGATTDP